MKEKRGELDALIAQVKDVLFAKDAEIKMSDKTIVAYIIAEFKKLQIEGLSFLKRAETDQSVDSVVISQYKNDAEDLIIEINKIIL